MSYTAQILHIDPVSVTYPQPGLFQCDVEDEMESRAKLLGHPFHPMRSGLLASIIGVTTPAAIIQ
jgi:hypothetical protein